MANRRQVLQAGAALGVLTGADLLRAPRVAATSTSMALHTVLYEQQVEAALALAREVKRRGGVTHPIAGDVTAVWRQRLQPAWSRSRAPTAGLTRFRSLFVLDMMAQEAGMRAVYIAHHLPRSVGYSHRLFGPNEVVATAFDPDPAVWPRQAAALMMRFPASVSVSREASNLQDARRHELPLDALVSWVIAPARS